jgi:hypothetical protein
MRGTPSPQVLPFPSSNGLLALLALLALSALLGMPIAFACGWVIEGQLVLSGKEQWSSRVVLVLCKHYIKQQQPPCLFL